MIDRLRKAERLRAIQIARDRLAEWTCAALESETARVQDRRIEMIEVLERETWTVAIAPNFVMRHLQSLAERHAALVAEKNAADERWRQERARLRMVERIVETRQTEAAHGEEAGQLAEAGEAEAERGRIRQRQG
jgi:hypothetical protein